MAFELTSKAFAHGAEIPARHTCDGEDRSPALAWTEPPPGTRALALVVDDPDAPSGTWTHWLLYGIEPTLRELPEGVPASESVPGVGAQGVNDFKKVGYGGPCPPRGPAHRYSFRLYALDAPLVLPPRRRAAEVADAVRGHVLAQAELLGRYGRK